VNARLLHIHQKQALSARRRYAAPAVAEGQLNGHVIHLPAWKTTVLDCGITD